MRTTLKRFSSGSSGDGGNQDAEGRTGPRVGPLSPASPYAVKRRGFLGVLVKVLALVVVAGAIAAGGLAGGVWLFLADAVEAVQPTDPDVIGAKPELADVPQASEPTTALVIGFDKRQGVDASDTALSDTIMLLRADPNTDTMTLLSFPRDLLVEHPGCKARGPWSGKINEAYASCKAVGTLKTVKQLTGLEINYLITVNFRAFRQIVDQVGGVWIDIDQRYFNDRGGPGGYATIDLQPGYQRLNGLQALDYARFRHTDNDIFRTLRQQNFVKAFNQRVESAITPLRLPSLIKSITEIVQIQQGGRKDIDPNTVLRYAQFLYSLPTGAFHQIKLDAESFSETLDRDLVIADGVLEGALAEFLSPDPDAPTKAADAATGKKAKVPKAEKTTITVVNGNGTDGAAADAAQRLREREYQAESGGDADDFEYFDTVVRYREGAKRDQAAAEAVAILFDGTTEVAPPGVAFDTMLQVVVGSTFRGTIAPGTTDRTPDKQEARVVERTDDILPLITEVQRKVGFPILVPTVREQDSILVPSQAIRAYKVNGVPAVKMVFRRGPVKYWGIQQTAMTDAPILNGPSVTRKIKGRQYKLYFSGPRLTMVAFEENGAAYWVTNTLDQSISNETMLAIAQGLQPRKALQ